MYVCRYIRNELRKFVCLSGLVSSTSRLGKYAADLDPLLDQEVEIPNREGDVLRDRKSVV